MAVGTLASGVPLGGGHESSVPRPDPRRLDGGTGHLRVALPAGAATPAASAPPGRTCSPPPIRATATPRRSPATGTSACACPPSGQGYAGGSVPAQSEVAGFYAQPPGDVQQRANIPTWSTLNFGDGSATFSLGSGTTTGWRQSLDLHDGVITTVARWHAPDGHVTDLRYDVFTDRWRKYVASVRLTGTPHWSGSAVVTDLIDGTPADLTSGLDTGHDASADRIWETVRTEGTGLVAGLASTVGLSASAGHPAARPMARCRRAECRAAIHVRRARRAVVHRDEVRRRRDLDRGGRPARGRAGPVRCGRGPGFREPACRGRRRLAAAVGRAHRHPGRSARSRPR